jgi:arylsulfatase A-like enzyme
MVNFRLLLAAFVVVSVAALPQRAAAQDRPNIVLIVADDLGYGDLGSYGAPDIKTPNLDRLAREGVRLPQFYANAPVCTPTRAALITGRYQQRLPLDRPLETNAATPATGLDIGLAATGRSLPQLMKNQGYATALIGKWHLGFKPEFQPNRHGFDYFFGFLAGYVDWYEHVRGDGQPDLWENGTAVQHDGYLGHELTKRAVSYVSEHTSGPFFLEVTFGAPHWPFQSPRRRSVAARTNGSMLQQPANANPPTRKDYAEIVEDLDASVGRILDAIESRGLARKTLVVFVSDNGGEWLSRNAPFFHRKDTVWEGGIRVPAIFRWTSVLPAGRTLSQVGITMDLSATFVTLAGGAAAEAGYEGMDLLPVLRGTAAPVERTLFWRVGPAPAQARAARSGDWKLVLEGQKQLLFDLSHDLGERQELAAQHPNRVRDLKAKFDAWEKDMDAEASTKSNRVPR